MAPVASLPDRTHKSRVIGTVSFSNVRNQESFVQRTGAGHILFNSLFLLYANEVYCSDLDNETFYFKLVRSFKFECCLHQ